MIKCKSKEMEKSQLEKYVILCQNDGFSIT